MQGVRIGVTGARQGRVLVTALERRGATVLWGPTLAGDRPKPGATTALETLLTHRPSWVVASTGVGVRTIAEAADRAGASVALRELLAEARVVARGAKAFGALRSLGVEPVFTSPQETDEDTAAWVARHLLPGEAVGVLGHGGGETRPYEPIRAAGADLQVVQPYQSSIPDDTGPAVGLIDAVCAGDLDAVTCTSPGAVRNLVAIAAEHGRSEELTSALDTRVALAAVGPVTARAAEEAGVAVAVMPLRQRTAELIRALEGWAARGARVAPRALRLVPAERRVDLPDGPVHLGEREFAVLASLVRRPSVACPPTVLAVEVWGHNAPDDAATVKHLVSRVRRKLGPLGPALETVRGVGYRYNPHAASHAT